MPFDNGVYFNGQSLPAESREAAYAIGNQYLLDKEWRNDLPPVR
jgi:hypothetical protein